MKKLLLSAIFISGVAGMQAQIQYHKVEVSKSSAELNAEIKYYEQKSDDLKAGNIAAIEGHVKDYRERIEAIIIDFHELRVAGKSFDEVAYDREFNRLLNYGRFMMKMVENMHDDNYAFSQFKEDGKVLEEAFRELEKSRREGGMLHTIKKNATY